MSGSRDRPKLPSLYTLGPLQEQTLIKSRGWVKIPYLRKLLTKFSTSFQMARKVTSKLCQVARSDFFILFSELCGGVHKQKRKSKYKTIKNLQFLF